MGIKWDGFMQAQTVHIIRKLLVVNHVKEIRDLSWVVLKFAGKVKPDVISLENVEQILNWGPLIAKRDKATGRVITLEKN